MLQIVQRGQVCSGSVRICFALILRILCLWSLLHLRHVVNFQNGFEKLDEAWSNLKMAEVKF